MNVSVTGNRLVVTELIELNAVTAIDLRKRVMEKVPIYPEEIVIDMKGTRFVDSSGLGALFSIYKAGKRLNPEARFRILDPLPHLIQLFELTQLDKVFEIAKSPPTPQASPI